MEEIGGANTTGDVGDDGLEDGDKGDGETEQRIDAEILADRIIRIGIFTPNGQPHRRANLLNLNIKII